MSKRKILIVDDEPSICSSLEDILIDEGFMASSVLTGEAAISAVELEQPEAVLLDIWMPGLDGIETLKRIKLTNPATPVIMMSGHASLQTAIDALKIGAVDFIEKPLDLQTVLRSINKIFNSGAEDQLQVDGSSIVTDNEPSSSLLEKTKISINTKPFNQANFWPGKEFPQRTLSGSAVVYGQGLHSGRKSGLLFEPLPENSGIHFARVGDQRAVPAHLEFVDSTGFATTIKLGDTKAGTIEHLMSAIAVFGITNLLVKCDGEVPVMDGSSKEFCDLFKTIGVKEQPASYFAVKVPQTIRYEKNSQEWIQIEPQDFLSIDYTLSYPAPVGEQKVYFEFKGSYEENRVFYENEIASARTFGFLKDIGYLQTQGLALGGRFDNCILIGEDGPLNTKLRYPDEFARHKVLDAIGDLSLLGRPLCGKITAKMTGHSDNIELLKALLAKVN